MIFLFFRLVQKTGMVDKKHVWEKYNMNTVSLDIVHIPYR